MNCLARWSWVLLVGSVGCTQTIHPSEHSDECEGARCFDGPRDSRTGTATRSSRDLGMTGSASPVATMPGPDTTRLAGSDRPMPDRPTPAQDDAALPGPFVDEDCFTITFESEPEFERQPGNLILIVDRATSEEQRRPMQIWRTTHNVLHTQVRRVATGLHSAATVLFPANPAIESTTCGDADAGCEASGLDVGPDPCGVTGVVGSGDDLLQLLGDGDEGSALEPGLSEQRPLLAALLRTDELLATLDHSLATTVIIIAAGDPSCSWDSRRALAIVDGWRSMGVTTHALSWSGTTPPGEAALRELVAAGGGGFELIPASTTPAFGDPPDYDPLGAATRQILDEAFVPIRPIPCVLRLSAPALFPEMLVMTARLSGSQRYTVPRELGWQVTEDGTQVRMDGRLCDAVEADELGSIEMIYPCPESSVPPLPSL